MFAITLEIDTNEINSLSMGGAHSLVKAYVASLISPLYVSKQLTVLLYIPFMCQLYALTVYSVQSIKNGH